MSDESSDKVGYQIKDFKIALKDFERMVKGADQKGRLFLIDGNNLPGKPSGIIEVDNDTSFNMRYREAWANWLLCVVLSFAHKQEFTFQEDKNGDGIILNRVTKNWFPVEHVSAMTYGKGEELPEGESRVLWAINKKIEKDKKIQVTPKAKHSSLLLME